MAVEESVDAEAAYYQAVEEFFVSRRGDPLFLSSADWILVHQWRTAGVPLRVVLRGIGDALDSHAHSWGREQKVGSLRYCAAEVEAARVRWERALALGTEEGMDPHEALRGFAQALEGAQGLGPSAAAQAGALARELRERAGGVVATATLEPWLARREEALLDALRQDLGAERVTIVDAAVDETLAPYRGRMPEKVLAQVRTDAVARRLLAERGLPRLSLFLL
ncbi:MAG: hypothetical protein HY317_03310 [Acidobacteria bacterium]|nr:hypothetical protein [Acidobacteriota bacterium]